MSTSPPAITSLTNARVKAAVRLRERRERDETGLTIIDGVRELTRALDSGVRVEEAFIASELLRTPDAFAAADRLRHRPSTVEVSPAVLAKVAFGDRAEGIVAVIATPTRRLTDLRLAENPLVVVVEGVEKPGNLGAIVRTADAAGADAVVAADPGTDLFNPNAIRASLGTIFSVPLATAPGDETLAWLLSHGIRPVATIVDADHSYAQIDMTGPTAIVLGSEAGGLGATWRTAATTAVSIPMAGIADSLNVSTAAAIVLYEAVRQRNAAQDRGH